MSAAALTFGIENVSGVAIVFAKFTTKPDVDIGDFLIVGGPELTRASKAVGFPARE